MHERRRIQWLAALGVAALVACGTAVADPKSEPKPVDPPVDATQGDTKMIRVIVKVKAPSNPAKQAEAVADVEALARKLGGQRISPMKGLPLIVLELPEGNIEQLQNAPLVERVQEDRPDRPY